MSTQSPSPIAQTLQSLNDSVWMFGALMLLAETGGLNALKTNITLIKLAQITAIPEIILTHALNLLIDMGFVLVDHDHYQLTSDAQTLTADNGLQQLIAQLQATFGKVQDLILVSREKNLRVGWHYQDPFVLQAQGLLSEIVATDFILKGSDMEKMLMQPGAHMMDVGAGAARISIKLCELYPNLCVTALEPSNTPFALAQTNIKNSPYHDRIDLRQHGIEMTCDKHNYDVIWIAQGFITDEHFLPGLAAIKSALKPGGMLLTYGASAEKPNRNILINNFSAAIYGGLRTTEDIIMLLNNAGFHDAKISNNVTTGYDVITAVAPA